VKKLRILLADDHVTVREGVKMIINAQKDMEVVAEAADGRVLRQSGKFAVLDHAKVVSEAKQAAMALRGAWSPG